MIERSMMAYLLGAIFMAGELEKGKKPVGDRTLRRIADYFSRMAVDGKLDVIPGLIVERYHQHLWVMLRDRGYDSYGPGAVRIVD